MGVYGPIPHTTRKPICGSGHFRKTVQQAIFVILEKTILDTLLISPTLERELHQL
jgi:hypothetical protein